MDDCPPALQRRVVIAKLSPMVDGGRHPAKRELGNQLLVTADILCDSHDPVAGALLCRHEKETEWQEIPLAAAGNDVFRATFTLTRLGTYYYTVEAWLDRFAGWRHSLERKRAANQDVRADLLVGAALVAAAAQTNHPDAHLLKQHATALADTEIPLEQRLAHALDPKLAARMTACPDRSGAVRHEPACAVTVDRVRARFSSWYEFFPRSAGQAGQHGTLRDAVARLNYVASMGFDVVYLPPIHPIGITHRKGRDNSVRAQPADPGSPWAIGSRAGGHTAIHPELGTLEDFHYLLTRAKALGLEIAMDVAFQASPDHPWVTEHPEWFVHRPDGTIQCAENPPKTYQDVYPFDFDSPAWPALWQALRGVIAFWIEHGVRIFRVDNPHTKPLPFWEWCIRTLKREHPDLIFLAEAFTRPKLMAALAKRGFSQSYTYFTWRNSKAELIAYMQELNGSELAEFFRPNFWPNTPDILPQILQFGGRPAFVVRLVLAATLSASYGIYGPAFELMECVAHGDSEEYRASEKYELKSADLDRTDSLYAVIRSLNQVRNTHPALQKNSSLRFHHTGNDHVICYSKREGNDVILVAVNLDLQHTQRAWLELDLDELGISANQSYQLRDVLSGSRCIWTGARNCVELQPSITPARVYEVRPQLHSEREFEYYL